MYIRQQYWFWTRGHWRVAWLWTLRVVRIARIVAWILAWNLAWLLGVIINRCLYDLYRYRRDHRLLLQHPVLATSKAEDEENGDQSDDDRCERTDHRVHRRLYNTANTFGQSNNAKNPLDTFPRGRGSCQLVADLFATLQTILACQVLRSPTIRIDQVDNKSL